MRRCWFCFKLNFVMLLVAGSSFNLFPASVASQAYKLGEKLDFSGMSYSFGTSFGTQGAEIGVGVGVNKYFSIALAATHAKLSRTVRDTGDLGYSFQSDLRLQGVDTDLRYHPWGSGFFAGVGLRFNRNQMVKSKVLRGGETLKLADTTYGSSAIESLSYIKTYNKLAPRLILGYDGSLHNQKKQISFMFGVGIMYQGTGSESYSSKPGPQASLLGDGLRDNLKGLSDFSLNDSWDRAIWPIATMGVKFRF